VFQRILWKGKKIREVRKGEALDPQSIWERGEANRDKYSVDQKGKKGKKGKDRAMI